MLKRVYLFCLISAILIMLTKCRKEMTGTYKPVNDCVKIEVLETGASFAAMQLTIDAVHLPKAFRLLQDDVEITGGYFTSADTVLFTDSLTAESEYTFRLHYLRSGLIAGISEDVQVTTMPLSSSDFTWQVDTVGAFPAQAYDLAVIDENNVWAVGKFPRYYAEDQPPNAVRWNGSDYEYHKIKVQPQGSDTAYVSPLQTVLAFAANDIWVFHYVGRYSHYNGVSWVPGSIPWESFKGNITKAWGFSSDDFYLIGTNGSITHYDGHAFSLMESGTDSDLADIHGYQNPNTGFKTVWIAGHKVLLELKNDTWIQKWHSDIPAASELFYPHQVSIISERFLALCLYNGPQRKNRLYIACQDNLSNQLQLSEGITFDWSMAFSGLNNILVAGDFGNIEHYNGLISSLANGQNYADRWFAIKKLNKSIFAVGILGQEALFIHGIQN